MMVPVTTPGSLRILRKDRSGRSSSTRRWLRHRGDEPILPPQLSRAFFTASSVASTDTGALAKCDTIPGSVPL